MRIIAGLNIQTQGRVYFDGQEVTKLTPRERKVAMVFQFPVLYDMNVYDNIAFPLRSVKVPVAEVRKKVAEVSEILGISNILMMRPSSLDMGTRQKVVLARSLVREPNVFLFDEPLTNLDPLGRLEMRSNIKQLQKNIKTTMIYVTHDQSEALTLAEKIAVMDIGVVVQYDEPTKLYQYPKSEFVGFFLGNPGMNFIPGTFRENVIDCGDFQYDMSELAGKLEDGAEFKVGIRPEHVKVSKKIVKGWIKGKCTISENIGTSTLLNIKIGETECKVKLISTDIKEGEDVYVNFPKEMVRLFNKAGQLVA